MCDQANHDNCEIIDEIEDKVVNLEDEIDYLRSRLSDKGYHINILEITVKDLVDEKLELQQKIEVLEEKLWKRNSLNVVME